MKLGVHIGYWGLGMGPQDQLQVVQAAERLGFDSVWTAEAYGFESAAKEIQDLYLDGKKGEAGEAIPDELIDAVSLCGPREVVRERLQAFAQAGVGTLMITPMAFTAEERIAQLAAVAELAA